MHAALVNADRKSTNNELFANLVFSALRSIAVLKLFPIQFEPVRRQFGCLANLIVVVGEASKCCRARSEVREARG